ncbi:MAG: methyltransferase domain-containing protein [Pseudomonadota bacterium]
MSERDDDEALAEAYERGLELEKSGESRAAAEQYREILNMDLADPTGASIRLAAMGEAPAPETAPPAYVTLLFDQTAEVFDNLLVEQLGYDVPMQLREALLPRGDLGRVLDLGCGTGLLGEALADQAVHLTGVDLSEGMVEIAGEKEVYDALYTGDATLFLAEVEPDWNGWDLIAATDMAPYLGDLASLIEAVVKRLAPGGLFAFSTETLPADVMAGRPYMVGPKQRYAHDEAYVHELLKRAGFTQIDITGIIVRYDEGSAVPGHLVIARR